VVIFAVLAITTTSWFEPVLFLLTMGIAIFLNMGTNIIFGQISFLSHGIAAVIQLAVAMDYSIFLLHSFTAQKQKGLPDEEAMAAALHQAVDSIVSSGVTTIVGFVALALACRKLVEEGVLASNPIRHFVTGVSAGIVGETLMLDLQYSEDSRAQVDLNCVMNELGEIIELQGTGEGRAFTPQEQQELVRLCAKGNRELLKLQREILKR
jgi:hypothetical protein